MTDYLTPIYADVRKWLLTLFPTTTIVKGYQNLVPIPKEAIIMTFLMEKRLDQPSTTINNGTATVFNSVQGTMQIDCYGKNAHAMSRQVSTMWQSLLTTDAMQNCQPLYCGDPKDLTFVNETGQYELRFMTALELQYNTGYEQSIQTTNQVPNVDITGIQ